MGAKYIFRLDDIAENMKWNNFFLLKEIFAKHNIKPIIGVIPNNEDEELLKLPKCPFNFWEETRNLQKLGWSIALHGFNHKYITKNAGIFGVNNFSEFAGVPYYIQNQKIQEGKFIFEQHGLKIDAFMAPAHTLDKTTLKALIDNNIYTVTDGFCLYPYYYEEILFVPQLLSTPRKMPFGIYTWCLHPNNMTEGSIREIEKFIKDNKEDIISFKDAKKYATNSFLNKLTGFINKGLLSILRSLRSKVI
ncbi:MAG: DUF2334 domain-containing protein [Tepidanaerobacteraceae bacterium]